MKRIWDNDDNDNYNAPNWLDLLPNEMITNEVAKHLAGGEAGRRVLAATCRRLYALLPSNKQRIDWTLFACSDDSGSLSLTKRLWNGLDPHRSAAFAAAGGNLDIIKWIPCINRHIKDCSSVISQIGSLAAGYGHLEILKWLRETNISHHNEPFTTRLCDDAAYGNQFLILKWLRSNGCRWSSSVYCHAAKHGNLEMFLWARINGCPFENPLSGILAANAAANGGHLKFLQYLFDCHDYTITVDARLCASAAASGDRKTLEYLLSKPHNFDEQMMAEAAGGGHLDLLKWLYYSSGCTIRIPEELDEHACFKAALDGHLEVLQWSHEIGCPWDKETCINAASGGHLNLLKWVYLNGCPCDDEAIIVAMTHNQLEILQWLVANGCIITNEVFITRDELVRSYGYENELCKWLASQQLSISE